VNLVVAAVPLHLARNRTVLELLAQRVLARIAPALVRGAPLHRRALAAAAARRDVDAEQLFEAAAAAYRCELAVEPLARLRVHQRMVRARAGGDAAREAAMMLEIVRGLNKLDRLESLRAPHTLLDARVVLADWLAARPESAAEPALRAELARAA
jgi:hypothetical protein